MAAMVRRHWAWILAIPLLVVACLLAIFQNDTTTHKARAQDAPGAPVTPPVQPPSNPADVATYQKVQQLRAELALTSPDMAALGLNSSSATNLFTLLKTFVTSNSGAMSDADGSVVQAQRNLRETMRKVNVGPRNDSLMASVDPLRQAVAQAQVQRDLVIAPLVEQVNMLLSSDQQAMWAAARSSVTSASQIGISAPGPYRFVVGLTDDQVQALDRTARHGGEPALLSAAGGILNASQLAQAQSAQQNQMVAAAAVASAEAQVLPTPAALVPHAPIASNQPVPVR